MQTQEKGRGFGAVLKAERMAFVVAEKDMNFSQIEDDTQVLVVKRMRLPQPGYTIRLFMHILINP